MTTQNTTENALSTLKANLETAVKEAEKAYACRKSAIEELQKQVEDYFLAKLPAAEHGYKITLSDSSIYVNCLYKTKNDYLRENEIQICANSRWRGEAVEITSVRTTALLMSFSENTFNYGIEYVNAAAIVVNLVQNELETLKSFFDAYDNLPSCYEASDTVDKIKREISTYENNTQQSRIYNMFANQQWVEFRFSAFEWDSYTRGHISGTKVRILKETEKTYQISVITYMGYEEVIKVKIEDFNRSIRAQVEQEEKNAKMFENLCQFRYMYDVSHEDSYEYFSTVKASDNSDFDRYVKTIQIVSEPYRKEGYQYGFVKVSGTGKNGLIFENAEISVVALLNEFLSGRSERWTIVE